MGDPIGREKVLALVIDYERHARQMKPPVDEATLQQLRVRVGLPLERDLLVKTRIFLRVQGSGAVRKVASLSPVSSPGRVDRTPPAVAWAAGRGLVVP